MADTRKLTVTSCNEIASGTGKKGEWTIYDVAALDEQGAQVAATLRSWKSLPIGQLAEYEVTRSKDENYPDQFFVSPPKRGGGGSSLGPKVDELRDRVTALEDQLAALRGRVDGLEKSGSPQPPSQAKPPANTGIAPAAAPPATSDDDIPF